MRRKVRTIFYLALIVSAALCGNALFAQGQVYSFSAPVTGFCDLDVMDYSDFENGQFAHATSQIGLGAVTETVYYNPTTQTLRQIGSVSLNGPTNVTLSFNEQTGSPLAATVSVNFAFPCALSFDTGFLASSGVSNEYMVNPPTIPITGTYSITAGTQTLTGAFAYALLFPGIATDLADITAGSLTLSQTSVGPSGFGAPDIVRNLTAADGSEFNLVGGVSDGTYRSGWSLGPITANAVPEPGIPGLISLGLIGLGLRWSRRTKS